MKQRVLVIIGILILLSVSLFWTYLLVFGVPEDTADVFADFGFPVENNVTENAPTTFEDTEIFVDTNSEELSQLTTRPVAGWLSITTSTTSEKLLYAEQGTGHIYSIDMSKGTEERIDNTTVTGTDNVFISPQGRFGVFVVHNSNKTRIFVRSIGINTNNESYLDFELPPNSENIKFKDDNTINYTYSNDSKTSGYEYDLISKTQKEIFSVPFLEIKVVWVNNDTYIYNKSAPHLKGTLYKITDNNLSSVLPSYYNLLSDVNELGDIIYTKVNIETDRLDTYTVIDGEEYSIPLLFIPEKCHLSDKDKSMWCASSTTLQYSRDLVSDWYKGKEQILDSLWYVNLNNQSANRLVHLTNRTGRVVDVDGLSLNTTGNRIYFRNKVDNTLWTYKLQL